ncbi:MAG: TlpA family protein disulfide reductase [Chloroflexi bacterium]|nr:TlpA family protein disulfide reductase [Chloroflexota bacterium]
MRPSFSSRPRRPNWPILVLLIGIALLFGYGRYLSDPSSFDPLLPWVQPTPTPTSTTPTPVASATNSIASAVSTPTALLTRNPVEQGTPTIPLLPTPKPWANLPPLLQNTAAPSTTPDVNQWNGVPAPQFTLTTLDGKQISLADLKGKAVFINFWATWCPPCKVEMPEIQAAYTLHQNDGLVVLGVNDTLRDALPDVKTFVADEQLTFPILLDEKGEVGDKLYPATGLPTSVFIARDGTIRNIHIGAMDSSQIETYIQEILH